jgi:LacI family transcriptional regulator
VPRIHGRVAGFIARVATVDIGRAILDANVPTILVGLDPQICRRVPGLEKLSNISSDSAGAARIAAAHLLEKKFRYYAFVGSTGRIWSKRREIAFRETIEQAGFHAFTYPYRSARSNQNAQQRLADWLVRLPKPLGLMACNDSRGQEVLSACRIAGIGVPEDVAVIGVDNDELFCELSEPPLTSVALNCVHAGYRAAELLDQLMNGRSRRAKSFLVEPLRVVARRSTDIEAIKDRTVAAALQAIRGRRAQNFTIKSLADNLSVSRRHLEIRFRKEVGRTILSEIQRSRLEHAKRVLQETDLAIDKVAEASGYSSSSYMIQVFRKKFGMTPARFRAQYRV